MNNKIGANSSKKIVSIILLVFCAVFLVVLSVGVGASLSIRNVAIIKADGQTTRLELNSKVSLEDDTIEKLSKKITVTSTAENGKFGELVMVTSKCVMFDYTIDDKTYYFSAIGSKLDLTPKNIYLTATGDLKITSYSGLNTFRNNVNSGTTYSGSTVTLGADINISGTEWTPIGTTLNKNFQGTFDGQGHTISNFVITKANTAGNTICPGTGFFGFIQKNCTIKNLQISDAKITLSNSSNNCVPYGYGILVGYFGNSLVTTSTKDIDDSLTGRSQSLYITNCSIKNSSISVPSGLTARNRSYTMAFGGMIGASTLGVTISNCYVAVDISFGSGTTWGIAGNSSSNAVGGVMGAHISNSLKYHPYGAIRITTTLYTGKISLNLSACVNGSAAGILGSASCLNSAQSPYPNVRISQCYANMDFSAEHVLKVQPICGGNLGEGSTFNEYYRNTVSIYYYKMLKPYYNIQMYDNYFSLKNNNTVEHAQSLFRSFLRFHKDENKSYKDDVLAWFWYDGKTMEKYISGSTYQKQTDTNGLLYSLTSSSGPISGELEVPVQVDPDDYYYPVQ